MKPLFGRLIDWQIDNGIERVGALRDDRRKRDAVL